MEESIGGHSIHNETNKDGSRGTVVNSPSSKKVSSNSLESTSESDDVTSIADKTHVSDTAISPQCQPLDNFLNLGLTPITLDSPLVSANNSACLPAENVMLHHVSPSIDDVSSTTQKSLNAACLPASPISMPILLHMDITRVCEGLYLSDFLSLSASRLQERNVTFVINATKEMPNVEDTGSSVSFMKLFVDDLPTEDIAQHFDLCADKIRDERLTGGTCLIHCALGISRSVSVCLAYLVKHEGWSLREAYFDLKKKRPIIRPNIGFWRQLITFEKTIRGRPSVKLNVYPMGVVPDVYRSVPRTTSSRQYSVSLYLYYVRYLTTPHRVVPVR